MIKIILKNKQLLLKYSPDRYGDAHWIDEQLKDSGSVSIRHTFTFETKDLVVSSDAGNQTDDDRTFKLAAERNGYYKIAKRILRLKHDLRLWSGMEISPKIFIANREISIFRKIDEMIDEPIIIGGDAANQLPLVEFEELIKNFPNSTEITHYARASISRILGDYFGTMSDAQKKLATYLDRSKSIKPPIKN